MSTLKDFDIGELVLQLNDELKFAFEVAQTGEMRADLRLDHVVARFGKEQSASNGISDKGNHLLKASQYPNEENWEIEVAYKYDRIADSIKNKTKKNSKTLYSSLLIEKLGRYSIMNIRGMTRQWYGKMKEAGILTIKELNQATPEKIQKLCRDKQSFLPLEFKTKVSLLDRKVKPFSYSEFDNIQLSSLLLNSPDKLFGLFKNKLNEKEIAELQSNTAIIFMIIDQRLASKLKLKLFSKNS